MSDVGQILQVASRGSKLSLALFDFAATVPSATADAAQLAKGTRDISRALWNVGANQKEDARITSRDARESVVDIVQQCQLGFTEIEAVVPLDMVRHGNAIMYGQQWEWSEVSRAKVQYLLWHLESLRLTLEVLSQAVKNVKVLEWSWQQAPNLFTDEAVNLDRLHLEGLVVDQQLAVLKASRQFEVYEVATGDGRLALITQDQGSQALTLFEDHAPNPRRLIRYQDTTLAETVPSKSETEQLALVRRISPDYIEDILERWTRLREIRKLQQPRVDSAADSDDDVVRQPSLPNGGPILKHINEEDEDDYDYAVKGTARTRSPRPIPRQPTSPQLASPPAARSWNPGSPSYFGAAPPVKAPVLGSRSTPTSPRGSFSAAGPIPNLKSPAAPRMMIPWRLRINEKVWDHENERIVKQNCSEHPSQMKVGRNVATEILASYVSGDAIEEKGHRYDRYMTEVGGGGSGGDGSQKSKPEPLFSIRAALTYPQIAELVRRTEERYESRYKRPRPRPTLDHAATAPLPPPGQYLQTPTDRHRSTSRGWDDRRTKSNRSSASSLNSASDSDHERERELKVSSRPQQRRDSVSSAKASSKAGTNQGKTAKKLIPVAAGAGIASILADVVEGLSHVV